MKTSRFEALARVAGVVLLLTAASCSKHSGTSTTANDNTMTQSDQSAPGNVAVSHVELGKNVDADKRITDQTTTFTPNETVYATVLTNGSAPNAEIKARWTYQDGQVVEESTQTIVPNGTNATEFHISKPDGLPAGKYRVEILLNGQPAGTQEFQVTSA
jgi:hypothetical protein